MGNPAQHKGLYTFEECLALEESGEIRYEFFRGEIYAMSGTKTNHNITVLNVATLLRKHYRGKG
jgi:Uma2 family endonuclease